MNRNEARRGLSERCPNPDTQPLAIRGEQSSRLEIEDNRAKELFLACSIWVEGNPAPLPDSMLTREVLKNANASK